MTTSNPTILVQAKYAEDVDTVQYTAPSTCQSVRVDGFTVSNTGGGGSAVLALRLVPSGATPGPEHVTKRLTLADNADEVLEPFWLAKNDSIETVCDVLNTVVIRIDGRVNTS